MQGALKSVLLIVSAVAFYCSVFGCVDSGFRGIHNLGKEGNDGGTSLWQETFFPQEDQFWMLCPAFRVSCVFCCGLILNARTVMAYWLCVLGQMTLPLWASVF